MASLDTSPLPETIIRPTKRRVPVRDLWTSRPIAKVIAVRDLKVKYKQSLIGPPWLLIQPLGILAGLVVAFNGVANVDTHGVPYTQFALVGLGIWTLVQMTLLNGSLTMIQNATLIRRIKTPRVAFLTSAMLSNLVAPAVILGAAIVLLVASGTGLPTQIVLLPALLAWVLLMTFGFLAVLAALIVRFRDVQTLLPFWSQAGLFLTPVGFTVASAPGHVQTLLALNPLSGLLEAARWVMLDIPPTTLPIITAAAFTLPLVAFGWWAFTRMEPRFADFV